MSRWTRLGFNRYAAATFALLAAGMTASAGCEIISRPDRSQINPGAGGAGGEGGSGGTGGTAPCTTGDDCPGTDTACVTRTCTAGVCGETFAPMGTPSSTQTVGDCMREICDGQGTLTTETDDTDIFDDQKDCTEDVCNAGTPENNPLGAGEACMSGGGKLCDGAGQCVECLGPTDCAENLCVGNACIPAQCTDTVKNGAETDTDCGGGACPPCADGLVCSVAADCDSGVCASGVCQAPTCTDTVENGAETDVDCGGGTCSPCGPGLECAADTDCLGGSCSGSTCLPTCTDQVANRNETDVDCGGPDCGACADGLLCAVDSDCASKVCTTGLCQAAACMDMVQNGGETGVDCGGTDCGACADGLGCNEATDCQSNVCTGNVCQMPTCADATKNAAETDVDCGGGACPTCELDQMCAANTDCTSNLCAGNVCVISLCGDALLTGAETCDDGNATAGDGCDAMCAIEVGFTCAGTPSLCAAICGDGLVKGAESCDDANTTGGDGCNDTCEAELGYVCTGEPSACNTVCGDGIPAGTEPCDDGNTDSDDACIPGCILATCGDGYVNLAAESCDDANTTPGDGCNGACQLEPFYACFGTPNVCSLLESEPNNACGATVTGPLLPPFTITGRIAPVGDQDFYSFIVPTVADVKIETFSPSVGACTTGIDNVIALRGPDCTTILVTDDQDGINSCAKIDPLLDAGARKLAPGTYFVRVEEFGNNAIINPYQLQVTFSALCGNGAVEGSEACDDGNLTAGDGCSPSCTVEQGYQCSSSPSVCALSCGDCNDGLDNDGDALLDAADPDCTLPAYFPACAAGQRLVVVRSKDTPKAIPDNNLTGIKSLLPVADVGVVNRAAVLLNITHTWDADVRVYLTSPGAAEIELTTENGSLNDNYTNTILDTTCATAVTAGAAPFSGCYKPEAPLTPVNGKSPLGTWTLRVADDAGGDIGTLNNWAAIFCTTP